MKVGDTVKVRVTRDRHLDLGRLVSVDLAAGTGMVERRNRQIVKRSLKRIYPATYNGVPGEQQRRLGRSCNG